MADGANPISARVATALGLLCVVVGFGLVGAAVINGIAWADGAMPVDDVAPGTLFVVRLTRYLLGLGIVGLKTTIFGWIAFGPGRGGSGCLNTEQTLISGALRV